MRNLTSFGFCSALTMGSPSITWQCQHHDLLDAKRGAAYHKGVETLLHVHFILFLKVTEIDLVVFGIEVVIRQLIE